jgi:predicted dehydrogenase
MYRFHPRWERIRALLRDGAIGEVRSLYGTFTFNSAARGEDIRFHREMGGGSLYDVGCYPISAARMLLAEEPQAVTVHALFSPEHGDVDMMAAGLLEFSAGVGMTFDCGMWAHGKNTLQILGTTGRIDIPHAFVASSPEEGAFSLVQGSSSTVMAEDAVNQWVEQAERFAEAVHGTAPLLFDAEDAVRNMRVLEGAMLSARSRSRVALS